jgi:hypothetical protein
MMQHNGSFGVRFPLILRGRRLLINSLLNRPRDGPGWVGLCAPPDPTRVG